MSNNSSTNNGIGFFGVLTILFITLKLCKVITWAWWLVLLPLYGPLLVVLIIVFFFFFVKIILD